MKPIPQMPPFEVALLAAILRGEIAYDEALDCFYNRAASFQLPAEQDRLVAAWVLSRRVLLRDDGVVDVVRKGANVMFYLLDDSDGCECWFISSDREHIKHAMKSFPAYREVSEDVYRVKQEQHLEEIARRRDHEAFKHRGYRGMPDRKRKS